MSAEHIQYRADIDGLRAIAVLAVVIYHASPAALPGGFVGVDFFFVISGYLISKIILKASYAGTFSFRVFYARRIRRIFPALIAVLGASVALGWFVLTPADYRTLGIHLMGAAGFASNLVLWSESGYFDQASELKPLLHLWSLGVEEQFYLIWPIILVAVVGAGISVFKVTSVVVLASFVLGLWMIGADPAGAFFLPFTRFWELLIGALLAIWALAAEKNNEGPRLSQRQRDILSLLGLILTAASLFFLNRSLAFPGAWALAPTCAAALLIAAGPSGIVNRTVLAHPAMVFIGLISYPLYLWHWPLLAFARIEASEEPALLIRTGLMILAVVLAWLTYRFLEQPIRRGKQKRYVPMLVLAVILVACSGGLIYSKDGFQNRFGQDVSAFINFNYEFAKDARSEICWLTKEDTADAFAEECTATPNGRSSLVLWGDSHAARLYPGLQNVVGERMAITQYTRNACPPILGAYYRNCQDGNEYVLSRISDLKPETVILFAHWSQHILEDSDRQLALLQETLQSLEDLQIPQVILLGPATKWSTTLPNIIAQLLREYDLNSVPQRTGFGVDPSFIDADRVLRQNVERRPKVTYVSAYNILCNDEGCLIRIGEGAETMTSWDYGHLTTAGATFLAEKILEETDDFGHGER